MKELFERLSRNEKTTLAALAAGVLALFLVLVFVSFGEKRSYFSAQKSLDRLGDEMEKAGDAATAAMAESKRWEDVGHDLEELRTKYFYDDAQGIMGLRRDLERIFNESGIRVSQIGYNYEDLEKGKYNRVVASFNFRGPYALLKRFLAIVEKFPKLLTVERIDFLNTGLGSGALELKIELAAYYEN